MPHTQLSELQRLHRSLKILSEVNHAIVRVRQLPALLDRICHITTEVGGFAGAWIAISNDQQCQLFALAAAGRLGQLADEATAWFRTCVDDKLSPPEPYHSGLRVICNSLSDNLAGAAWYASALAQGGQSFAALPLMIGDSVLGSLNLLSAEADFFDSDEITLIDQIASDLSFALTVIDQEEQRVAAERTLARYAKRLEILHQIDAGIIAARSIDELIRATLQHLRQLIPFDRARVGIIEPSGQTIRVLMTEEDPDGMVMTGDTLPVVVGMWDEFGDNITRIIDLRVSAENNPDYKRIVAEGLAAALQVKLVAPNGVIGMLGLGSKLPDVFLGEHVEIAADVGSQLAIALRQIQMGEEVERNIASLKAADAALVQSEARYRSVVEDQTELICRYAPDLLLTFVNRAYAEAMGTTPDALVGRSIIDRIPLEDRSPAMDHVKSLTPENSVATSEHQSIWGDGTVRWLQWTDRAIFDADGNIIEYQGVGRDVTERRNAEQALLQVQDVLEQRVADRTRELEQRVQDDQLFQQYLRELHDITIELTQVDSVEELFRTAVQHGRDRLGFDRLGIILYDPETNVATGTFGTGVDGKLSDERHMRFTPTATGMLMRSYRREERFAYENNVSLYTGAVVTGQGWNAAAVLWNGSERLGWLAADNGLRHEPASKAQLDILALYGLTIGTLLGRKQSDVALAEQRTFLRQIIDASPSMIFVKDYESRFVLANPMLAKMFNLPLDAIIGKNDTELNTPPAEAEQFRLADQKVIDSGEPLYIEEPFTTASGELRWLQTTKVPVASADGTTKFVLGISTDITERKQNERSIRDALDRERELGELKSRFVSMASHEFRTPLATILALTETLVAYRTRMEDAQVNERLEKIREQVDHLRDIMEDMLQLARMQARRTEFIPMPLDFDMLCRGVLEEFQSDTDIGHQIVYQCDPALRDVVLDKKLMRQIVSNLVSNAIKYSAFGTSIRIDAVAQDGALLLTIRDEGIGIPEPDLKHLFDPFHRATNVGTISGTGLGLTIAKESVELHGGSINVESQLDVGTTFILTIPLRPGA